jgi:aminoglycoside phosphotransferase (APT) family kinase protein
VEDRDVTDLLADPERLAAYLLLRTPGATAVRDVDVVKFPRGVSRETWFVTYVIEQADGGEPRSIVVRRDLPGGSVCPSPLRREYEIYRRLEGTAVPIARALWFEDDPAWQADGRPHYVREHIDGSWEIPGFQDPDAAFDDFRIAISREHLRCLAAIHTCDWEALGFGDVLLAPTGPDTCATTAIDRLVAELDSFQIEPMPVVEEAVGWLRENAPRSAPRVSLLKGTNGLGEEVFRDGEIVAMSDWELASIGDPASDFAHLQDLIPDVIRDGKVRWGQGPALEYYEEISGIAVAPAAISYYQVLGALEMVVFAHNAAIPLVAGTDHLVRLAWVSTEVLYWAKNILAGAAGVFRA